MTELICRDVITDASAWTASTVDEKDWRFTLTRAHNDEIAEAARAVADRELGQITQEDFPLPELGPLLAAMVDDLEYGRGFAVISGLDIAGLSIPEMERTFFGMSTHLGYATAQTRTGELLNHVRDHGLATNARGYTSKYGLPFHTDGTDLLALLCVSPAEKGGLSSIASSVSVHNHVLRTRPELLGLLYKEYLYDKRGAEAEGESPYYANQIFGYFDGKLACRYYNRGRLESAQEKSGIRISEVERAALDLFEEAAASKELRLDLALRTGDIMLIDNNVVLHSRTEFEDGDSARRHLMRLALNPYRQREFQPGFAKYRHGYPQTEAASAGAR